MCKFPQKEVSCISKNIEIASADTQRTWFKDIVLPPWIARLVAEAKDIPEKFARSALLPIVVVLGLIALIYNSGQLQALAIALSAPLSNSDNIDVGGFGANYLDLIIWLLSCSLLVWSWFLYFFDPDKPSGAEPPLAEIGIMHWILPFLILCPFFYPK